jgi:hypothetical protein
MKDTISKMQDRLSELAAICLRNQTPLNELTVRRYAVGYHLHRTRAGESEARQHLGKSLKALHETRKKHKHLLDVRTKQLSLAL